MSKAERQSELREKTRQLLQGSLKHVRVVGLAAALLPVAAVPASAAPDQHCSSAGNYCGFVWNDENGNGIQDAGEPGIEGASVTMVGSGADPVMTDSNGYYEIFAPPGTYELQVQIPNGSVPSPTNAGTDDTIDSDGALDGGNSVVTVTVPEGGTTTNTDFGFVVVNVNGTGTPGYWMNHPEAWPASIDIGGVTYTRDQAIALLREPGNKDKTLTLFASLVAAKLNTEWNHTNAACVADTIAAADAWLVTYPLGIGVRASSYAWKVGEPLHRLMDNYNNGMLCAPHRD